MSRLDELEQAARAATPGPWFYNSYSAVFACGDTVNPTLYDQWAGALLDASEDSDWERGGKHFDEDYLRDPHVASVPAHHGDTATGRRIADAEFIAQANPDTVLALIALVKELRDALAEIAMWCEEGREAVTAWPAQRARAALASVSTWETTP